MPRPMIHFENSSAIPRSTDIQTFLPYKSFESSARVLDRARLGKQRVEALQIMKALVLEVGWVNHPATRMWSGHLDHLLTYQQAICGEWARRGYKDSCLEKTTNLFNSSRYASTISDAPSWLGLKKFHSPHRGNLLRKDPEYYGRFGWKELPMEGYFWPVPTEEAE